MPGRIVESVLGSGVLFLLLIEAMAPLPHQRLLLKYQAWKFQSSIRHPCLLQRGDGKPMCEWELQTPGR
jgi:hypothetical protein